MVLVSQPSKATATLRLLFLFDFKQIMKQMIDRLSAKSGLPVLLLSVN